MFKCFQSTLNIKKVFPGLFFLIFYSKINFIVNESHFFLLHHQSQKNTRLFLMHNFQNKCAITKKKKIKTTQTDLKITRKLMFVLKRGRNTLCTMTFMKQ